MIAKRLGVLALVLLVLTSVTLSAFAAEKNYVLKFAHMSPVDPYAQPTSAYAAVFKSLVENLSGNRIKVDVFPAGQLGDQRSYLEQARKGTIEISSVASGVLATALYPDLSVLDIPYLFSSTEVAWNVLSIDNPVTKKLIEDIRKKTGLRIISMEPMGFRHFTNDRKVIRRPEDLKGLKIRVMEVEPHVVMVRSMGAFPTPIPFTELYTSLQTGVVDGEENALMNLQAAKLYETQKYLTLDGHLLTIAVTFINDKAFESLPEDLQQVIIEAAKAARTAAVGLNYIMDATALDFLKKKGMQVYSPTKEELNAFRKTAQKPVLDWEKSHVDQKLVNAFMDEIDKAEKKAGNN